MMREGFAFNPGSGVEKKEEPLERGGLYLYGYLTGSGLVKHWNKLLGYVEPDLFDSRGKSRVSRAEHKAARAAMLFEARESHDPEEAKRQIKTVMAGFKALLEKHEPESARGRIGDYDPLQKLKELIEAHNLKLNTFSVCMIWTSAADEFLAKGMPELSRAISEVVNEKDVNQSFE